MARLVREEMLHYEQVLVFMDRMGIEFRSLSPSRYARMLRESVRTNEDDRLVDLLIVGAIVEARSVNDLRRCGLIYQHHSAGITNHFSALKDVTTRIIWH